MIAFVPLSGKKYPILGALAHGLIVVDICRAAKYPPLFTDTEVNNYFSMYQTSG